MRIEPTTIDESKKLLDLAQEENVFIKSKKDSELTITEILEQFENDPKFAIYTLFKGRKRIGFITAFPNDDTDTVSIGVMYIKPKYRGRGFGKVMVELFIKQSKRLGYKKIFTKTWSSNTASTKVFLDLGFIETERKENDRVNGDDTVKYLLTL